MAKNRTINEPEFSRAAPNLLLPKWALDKLLQLPTEELSVIVKAAINYFQKGEKPDFSELPTPWIIELIFSDLKKAIDENEAKYRKRTEASSRGGKNTQAKNKAAREGQPANIRTLPTEPPTYNNILSFAEEKGYGQRTGEEFWNYNADSGEVDQNEDGEYYLKADRNGKPLYNWQSALIGFANSGYNRAEWEEAHGIDPRTHTRKSRE